MSEDHVSQVTGSSKYANSAAGYLALGDSLVSGFNAECYYCGDYGPPGPFFGIQLRYGLDVSYAAPPPDDCKCNSHEHVGYPQVFAWRHDLKLINAACPGETAASFIDKGADDAGCKSWVAGDPDLLHAAYDGSQFSFAKEFLENNPRTQLVTIGLGWNDVVVENLRCKHECEDDCAAQCEDSASPGCIACVEPCVFARMFVDRRFFAAVDSVRANLATIVEGLRAAADDGGPGYTGPIVIFNEAPHIGEEPRYWMSFGYYAMVLGGLVAQLNAQGYGPVLYGDAYGAFRQIAIESGYLDPSSGYYLLDFCEAGLEVPWSDAADYSGYGCDVHLSWAGNEVIADILEGLVTLRQD